MAGVRPRRARHPPQRLGWESDSDNEVYMDSDSDLSENASGDNDSDSDIELDNDSQQSTQPSQSQTETETESESDEDDEGWVRVDAEPNVPDFVGNEGITLPDLGRALDAVDYFSLFLTDDFFTTLSEETNIYATQVIEATAQLKPNSRLRDWRATTASEMKVFIALYLSMGLDDRPTYESYWSTNPVFHSTFWASVMSRNRFTLIMKFFHIVDNVAHAAGGDNADKVWKIRPLLDLMDAKFPELFYPSRDVCVDETMVPFTGRLGFKQYIPIKPQKYGIKLYQLCDSSTGYTYKLKVYTGREGPDVDRNHTYNVVMGLIEPLLGVGHILWTDNYYTGIPLVEELSRNDTCMAGTLRLGRVGVPRFIKDVILDKGDYKFRRKGDIMVLKWRDKKVVTFLSSAHTAEMVNSRTRTDADGQPVQVPRIKEEYDMRMNGVDKNDQNVSQYAPRRKSMKWYKKLALYFISLVRFQAYILYSRSTDNPVSQLKFILELVLGLVEHAALPPVPHGRPRTGDPPQRITARHFVAPLPPTDSKTTGSRRCVVCCITTGRKRRRGERAPRRKETCFHCRECDVALCFYPCFELYHTYTDYKKAYQNKYGEA